MILKYIVLKRIQRKIPKNVKTPLRKYTVYIFWQFCIIFAKRYEDESFKKEYEALEPEYEIISSLIDARKACNITQKQLFELEEKNHGLL